MNQICGTTAIRLRSTAAKSYHTIQAIPRTVLGPRISKRDRDQGRIPTVVSSPSSTTVGSSKLLLTTEIKQIKSLLKSVGPQFFCSTTFKLQVRAGSGSSLLISSANVIPTKLHYSDGDMKTGKLLNLALAWAEEGSHLEVDVPIVIKGGDSCPGIQKGGQLKSIRTKLKYLCPAESIPQKIEVDISKLDVGDRILLKDIQVDPSLKLLSTDIRPICKIVALEAENSQPLLA